MVSTDVFALERSELNAFLFAEVGLEESGQRLSVFSTLARLGVDPWQEAGRLDRLPRAAAVDGLARTIAAMPAGRWMLADATDIAIRLVALLPSGGGASRPPGAVAAGSSARLQMIIFALLATLVCGLAFDRLAGRDASGGPASDAPNAALESATAGGRVPTGEGPSAPAGHDR